MFRRNNNEQDPDEDEPQGEQADAIERHEAIEWERRQFDQRNNIDNERNRVLQEIMARRFIALREGRLLQEQRQREQAELDEQQDLARQIERIRLEELERIRLQQPHVQAEMANVLLNQQHLALEAEQEAQLQALAAQEALEAQRAAQLQALREAQREAQREERDERHLVRNIRKEAFRIREQEARIKAREEQEKIVKLEGQILVARERIKHAPPELIALEREALEELETHIQIILAKQTLNALLKQKKTPKLELQIELAKQELKSHNDRLDILFKLRINLETQLIEQRKQKKIDSDKEKLDAQIVVAQEMLRQVPPEQIALAQQAQQAVDNIQIEKQILIATNKFQELVKQAKLRLMQVPRLSLEQQAEQKAQIDLVRKEIAELRAKIVKNKYLKYKTKYLSLKKSINNI